MLLGSDHNWVAGHSIGSSHFAIKNVDRDGCSRVLADSNPFFQRARMKQSRTHRVSDWRLHFLKKNFQNLFSGPEEDIETVRSMVTSHITLGQPTWLALQSLVRFGAFSPTVTA